jgi:hypothetical protein
MSVQDTYNTAPEMGYPGQLAEPFNEPPIVETFWSEGGVYPGRGCIKGTATTSTANKYNDRQIPFGVKVPGSAGDVLVGLPIRKVALPDDGSGLPYYADESLVGVLKRGTMYALAGEAVTARDPVYVVHLVGDSGLAVGDLIKDAVAGTTGEAIVLPNAYWKTSAAAGGIGIVKITQDPEG